MNGKILSLGFVAALLAATQACTTEAYCFSDCDSTQPDGGGGTGNVGGSGGNGGSIVQPDAQADADADAPDSGCDDTQTDPRNCGSCGHVCNFFGTIPECVNGTCEVGTCASGFFDANGDLTIAGDGGAVPNPASDGCECQQSGNPIGTELCDNIDNDCDGQIDEDFDLQTDLDNCGFCNNPCPDLPNTTKACGAGQCEYTCLPDWGPKGVTSLTAGCTFQCADTDNDGSPGPQIAEICNGVDEDCNGQIDEGTLPGAGDPCVPGNDPSICPGNVCNGECQLGQKICTGTASGLVCVGGVLPVNEVCDTKDNDCDGQVDEGFDFQTDELNCGACNQFCATGDTCNAGSCSFVCTPGTKDLDGNPANRCEYACPVWPTRGELCDGIDDDCDGVADNGVVLGGACNANCPAPAACVTAGNCAEATSSQTGGCYGVCANSGVQTCVGGLQTCTHPTQALVETCNNLDDNCEGRIDEGFDKKTDPFNCGTCGNVCTRPNVLAMACTNGTCSTIITCEPGFSDVDGNPANGCEYSCPVNPPVTETCNNVDDDCDGVKDNNPQGVGQSCTANCPAPAPCIAAGNCTYTISAQSGGCYGVCKDDGITACTTGALGCTHPIKKTELCNSQDDDCDGLIDNGFNIQTDPANCGNCGHVCSLPGTATHGCAAGSCTVVTCDPGFKNLDNNPANGCEYACTNTNGGVEICDGIDNDCDGTADDSPTGMGVSCQSNCPGGVCRGICTAGTTACVGGAPVCQGGTTPQLESCNNLDDDCDGTVDDGFNKQTDPNNCNTCGNVCNLPNAVEGCAAGACTVVACLPGFANLDNNAANGCEHTCAVYPTSTEICDGKDNDCDGLVDGADSSMATVTNFCKNTAGTPCAGTTPSCQGASGWRCNYPATVQTDANGNVAITETLCDGIDNNCNTQVDETFALKGTACSTGVGACAGTANYTCKPDKTGVECLATAQPLSARDESCDGIDNNCDGNVDERTVSGTHTCYTAAGGVGAHTCTGYVAPMVAIGGGKYMFMYEASRPDASSTDLGINTDRACSDPTVLPWSAVNYASAAAACAALKDSTGASMRLCTEAEWQTGCLAGQPGTFPTWGYTAAQTSYVGGRCNDSDASTTQSTWPTGSAAQCASNWGGSNLLYDMSGNVAEWTSTCFTQNSIEYCRVRGGNTATLPLGTACGFSFVLEQKAYANLDTGFRCCSDNAP